MAARQRSQHAAEAGLETCAEADALLHIRQRLHLMSEASSQLLASPDPEGIIQSIAERVAAHLDADVFFNYSLDEATGRLHLNACGGVAERTAKRSERLELGQAICGCVARDGERIISNDVQHNGDERAGLVRRMGVRTYVCHPLKVGALTVGTLSFGSKGKDAFSDDEIEFMRTTADQISTAMERSRVERDLGFQSFLLESVSDSVIAYIADGPEVENLVYVNEAAHVARGYSRAEMLQMRMTDLIAPDWRPTLLPRMKLLATGQEVRAESAHLRKDGSTFPVEIYMRQVDFGGRRLVVNVSRDITQRKVVEARLEKAVEEQIALSRQSARRAGQLQVLKELADIAARATSVGETASEFAESVRERFGAKAVSISRVADTGDHLVSVGHAGFDPEILRAAYGEARPDVLSVIARAFTTRRPVLSADLSSDESVHAKARTYLTGQGYGSLASVPLLIKDEVLGTVTIAWDQPREFPDDEVAFLESAASEIALGVQSAALVESQNLELAKRRLLQEVAVAPGAALELKNVVMQMLKAARRQLGLQAGDVRLLSPDGKYLQLLVSLGWPDEICRALSAVPLDGSGWMASRVVTENTVLTHEDEGPSTPERDELLRKAGVLESRYIALPLSYRNQVFGMMSLTFSGRRAFRSQERDLFEAMGRIMSQAIQNARAYEVEHSIAETLQETLVTLPFRVEGVDFARGYESATQESGRVGGDFVDLFEVTDDVVGLVIGDVSGKGIDAAVVTSLVRNTIRAHALDGLPASDVIAKTNRVIMRFTKADSFVTLFFGLLDTRTRMLRYVSAGHPPAMLVSRGEVSELPTALSPLAGAFEDAEFIERGARLRVGDRLVIYTDGVSEARSPKGTRFFGSQGLRKSLEKSAGTDARGVADALIRDVVRFSKGVLRDDAAVLVVEPTGIRPREESA